MITSLLKRFEVVLKPIFSPIFSWALVQSVVAIAVATAANVTVIINSLRISL
ncbi:hypothetical protein [Halotia branconii]|uniref:Uncharacterized protein n=1 Tax=Halotia branconii CENA392 TaxID=1539056 RepID=A0AAJ6NTY1_9CYAN|nr:hypothetical protein [Halotia branconii]WGV26343.1 hypothetical protein QI031_02180 [Halotia branconii CENA392]